MKARIGIPHLGRYVGLLIVTALASALAALVMLSSFGRQALPEDAGGEGKAPPSPVSVVEVRRETIPIIDSYSGMIEPLERYVLGFETAGRIKELGRTPAGDVLDVGARVKQGQLLAKLDDEMLRAKLAEAKARRKDVAAKRQETQARETMARLHFDRTRKLLQSESTAATEAEYQDRYTDLMVAQAQLVAIEAQAAMAEAQEAAASEAVEDAQLLSPVDGVIARRPVNAGESVNPQQTVMEVLEVDQVLMVVGVPEAYVGEIAVGQTARVELLARNRFGKRRAETSGRVRRVAEAADGTTGLFDVETLVDNSDRTWKPGLIGRAHITVDEVDGYRIPIHCAVFRRDQAYLFTIEDGGNKARRVDLGDGCVEQGADLIVPAGLLQDRRVVDRGQHRLIEGREVEVLARDGPTTDPTDTPTRIAGGTKP